MPEGHMILRLAGDRPVGVVLLDQSVVDPFDLSGRTANAGPARRTS